MTSKIKNAVEQGQLSLARKVQKSELPIGTVAKQKTLLGAVNLCITESGLEDKEIYMALNIDAGYFSNIKKGTASLKADLINDFCQIVGNTIYPEWIAYQVGSTLVLIQTEAERRADAATRRAEEAESKLAFLTKVMQGKDAA